MPVNSLPYCSFSLIIDISLMSSEEDVVARAIKGDGEAFAQLYEEHFDKVYRYVHLRLGDRTEAEDLTQDVFTKALEAIGSYKWRSLPFASWLFRIAHNEVIDYLRKHERVEKVAMEDVTLVAESDPLYTTMRNIEIERLVEGIKNLSPAQREVISLRFGAELSIAEVAKALGKSPGTIKALQYNGIVALRNMLSADR